MWQAIRSFLLRKGSVAPAETRHVDSRRSRVTIVSLLEDQDRSLIAEVCYQNQWDVFFAKTCAEARQVSEQIKPHVILLDRDLADGDWRNSLSACAASSAGACTMLISRVADDYLWNEVVCNGGYDVLPKPLREQDVLRAVKFAWSYWNSTRQTAPNP
jgi:DNA-binding NtrC family response regulator